MDIVNKNYYSHMLYILYIIFNKFTKITLFKIMFILIWLIVFFFCIILSQKGKNTVKLIYFQNIKVLKKIKQA